MKRIAFAVLLALVVPAVQAQPVKCVDAAGKIRYVDAAQAGQECKPVADKLEIVPAPPGGRPAAAAAKGDPGAADRVKAAEQKLDAAKRQLAEQESVRSGDERNFVRVQERLKPYQDAVQAAEMELERARSGR